MVFLAVMAVIVVLIALGLVIYALDPKEDEPKKKRNRKMAAQLVLAVVLLNSVTFSIARGLAAMSFDVGGKPKLVTFYDAGIYQTDEVHYLVAGMQMKPEDIMAILPDNLHGTIKAVRYQQFQYQADAIADELDDDILRNDYQTVTVWALGTAAMTVDYGSLRSTMRDRANIVMIDPCPNTLVLKPELQGFTENGAPWTRAGAYLLGWLSMIPGPGGRSFNLATMQQYELAQEADRSTKPDTDKVIGLVVSQENQYLQVKALQGLYADAIQASVPVTHADIVNSREQYQAALQQIWTQHLAELEAARAAAEEYEGSWE